jgi:flagellar basal-body rod modification protein FlgD
MNTAAAISSATPVSTLGQATTLNQNFDTFLKLLTTQLQYQDPLSPLDTNQFTQQLVQFSGVEQSIKANQNLETLIASVKSNNLSNAATYLGRTVTANTSALNITQGTGGTWQYKLGAGAAETTLSIVNARGTKVFETTGDVSQGTHAFVWDGKDASGRAVPSGTYRLQVASTTGAGTDIDTSVSITGRVDSLETSGGVNQLIVANTPIDFAAIQRIDAN